MFPVGYLFSYDIDAERECVPDGRLAFISSHPVMVRAAILEEQEKCK